MRRGTGTTFDYDLDHAAIEQCMTAGKCLVCGWKPRPEFRSIYAEWRMHFSQGKLFYL